MAVGFFQNPNLTFCSFVPGNNTGEEEAPSAAWNTTGLGWDATINRGGGSLGINIVRLWDLLWLLCFSKPYLTLFDLLFLGNSVGEGEAPAAAWPRGGGKVCPRNVASGRRKGATSRMHFLHLI